MSNFRRDIGGWRQSLVQVRWFSPATGRAGCCRQISLCVGSTHSIPATLGLPHSRVCAFPSTLLRLPATLYGTGPALHVVPVFGYSTKARTWLGLCFVPSLARAAQAARSLTGVLSPGVVRLHPSAVPASVSLVPVRCVRLVSVLGSWPLAATLPVDVNHPESQEVFG